MPLTTPDGGKFPNQVMLRLLLPIKLAYDCPFCGVRLIEEGLVCRRASAEEQAELMLSSIECLSKCEACKMAAIVVLRRALSALRAESAR
jgi:hypothetical protein